jgi:hypothetical protein
MSELIHVINLTKFQGYPQAVVTLWITPYLYGPAAGYAASVRSLQT